MQMQRNSCIVVLGLEEQGLALVQCFSRCHRDVHFFVDTRKGKQFREYTSFGVKHRFDSIDSLRRELESLQLNYKDRLRLFISSASLLTDIRFSFREIYDLYCVSSCPLNWVDLFSTKNRMYDYVSSKGCQIPRYKLLNDYSCGDLVFPFVLKRNIEKILSFKTIIINSQSEFEYVLSQIKDDHEDIIAQEFVGGTDWVDLSYHGYIDKGIICGDLVVEEIRHYPTGVSCFLKEVAPDLSKMISTQINDLLIDTDYSGFIQVDLKYHRGSHQSMIMDINTRTPGSHSVFYRKFINWKEFYSGIPDNPIPLIKNNKRIRWINIDRDMRATRILDSPFSTIKDSLSSDWDVFCWQDPFPFIMSFFLPIKVRLSILFNKVFRVK